MLTEIKPSAMTADQLECYNMFCDLVGGDHHITGTVFGFGRGIKCSVFSGMLSTFDFDYLTRLVIMAHDRCIRAEILASGPGRIGIALHKRHTREGSISQRHPTIEQSILYIQR
jgi:hypothetical protein